jgi:hypothetical protein
MNSDSAHTFKATRSDGKDMMPELSDFARFVGLEKIVPGRYSFLLLLELYAGVKSGRQNPKEVIDEIEFLEGFQKKSGSKQASPLHHEKLKGLWHKHYLEDGLASMARNLSRGLGKYGIPSFEKGIADAQLSGEERYVTKADIPHIVNDTISGNWERLKQKSLLTGEWLIFAQHENKNYYLCLGRHKSDPQILRAQIDAFCVQEFPFLINVLSKNTASGT